MISKKAKGSLQNAVETHKKMNVNESEVDQIGQSEAPQGR